MMPGRRAFMITGARSGGWRRGRRCGLGGGDTDPLSRPQHQGARPTLSAICAEQRRDRAPRWRLPLYGGTGMVRRWPATSCGATPERPDAEMGGGNRRSRRVSPPLALYRQHPATARAACSRARWMPTAHPHRIRRHDHGARRPLRGQAPDRPQRRRRQAGRSIWFSDNGADTRGNYLGHKAPWEFPFRVYRLDPGTGVLTIAVDDMKRPNGLAFSPDETLLYIVDTPGPGRRTIQVYDVVDQGTKVTNRREFWR